MYVKEIYMEDSKQQSDADAYYGGESFGDGEIDMSFLDEKPTEK